jgi:hypothetical protein
MRPLDIITYQVAITMIVRHLPYVLFIDAHKVDRIVALAADVYALGVCYEEIEWAIINSLEYQDLSDLLYATVRRH